MTGITIFDAETGRAIRKVRELGSTTAEAQVLAGEVFVEGDYSLDSYLDDGGVKTKPFRPSDFHEWDWATKAWLPNLPAAIAAKKAAVESERAGRSVAPITFSGSPFDADSTARERISGTLARLLRGDGLPAGWVGWRDYDNAMHWGSDAPAQVQTQLAGLSAAIEDREQALLIAAWTHKAALDAIDDIDDIDDALAYDVAAGWPA